MIKISTHSQNKWPVTETVFCPQFRPRFVFLQISCVPSPLPGSIICSGLVRITIYLIFASNFYFSSTETLSNMHYPSFNWCAFSCTILVLDISQIGAQLPFNGPCPTPTPVPNLDRNRVHIYIFYEQYLYLV